MQEVQWLKSPVSERKNKLQSMAELELFPYNGKKRKMKLFRTIYTLGSAPDCDLTMEDPFVSGKHAEIRWREEGDGYEILDLSSKNGIFLNGVRINRAPLPLSGVLEFGRSRVQWKEGVESAMSLDKYGQFFDPSMIKLIEKIKKVSASSLPVLILGETGTGKELVAQMIHDFSPRASGPFVPINGSLTGGNLAESELFGHRKGAFTGAEANRIGAMRSAHRGTLFIDEVADIPRETQVKLLRVLEKGEVKPLGSDSSEWADFRLVSATSQALENKVKIGTFRSDLFFRLCGTLIQIPPLRDRPKDIVGIAENLAKKWGKSIHPDSLGILLSYTWPGNVRELISAIARACVEAQGDGIQLLLPQYFQTLDSEIEVAKDQEEGPLTLEEIEKNAILHSLKRNGWGRSITSKELKIARSTLNQKMKRYKIRDQWMN